MEDSIKREGLKFRDLMDSMVTVANNTLIYQILKCCYESKSEMFLAQKRNGNYVMRWTW